MAVWSLNRQGTEAPRITTPGLMIDLEKTHGIESVGSVHPFSALSEHQQ